MLNKNHSKQLAEGGFYVGQTQKGNCTRSGTDTVCRLYLQKMKKIGALLYVVCQYCLVHSLEPWVE
jgi:hypothetical protein